MTGNGVISKKNADDWGMVYYCFDHITMKIIIQVMVTIFE